jgi:hypothetical protein
MGRCCMLIRWGIRGFVGLGKGGGGREVTDILVWKYLMVHLGPHPRCWSLYYYSCTIIAFLGLYVGGILAPSISAASARAMNSERPLSRRKNWFAGPAVTSHYLLWNAQWKKQMDRASSSLSTEPPKTLGSWRGLEDENGGHVGMTPPDTSNVENGYSQAHGATRPRRLRVALSATLPTVGSAQTPVSGERGLFVTSLTTD